ncbi:hypothetical protein F4801DRAFT_577763 [Xylaria longipes]|nr:hypothetical protein F4801DRAFT_577763 [Xylaria longipes]
MNGLRTDPKKAQPESDLGGKTERAPEDAKGDTSRRRADAGVVGQNVLSVEFDPGRVVRHRPVACVSTWFAKKRGTAMGIMVTGSSLGSVVFSIIISRLIDSIGYPWALMSVGFLILGLQIIAILAVLPFVLLLVGIFVLTYGIFIAIVYLAVQAFQEAHTTEQMAQYLVSIFNAASQARGTFALTIIISSGCPIPLVFTTVYCY